MIRSWGVVALTGNAQPLVGDVTTAAFVVPAEGQLAKVQVANSAKYQVGDRIILGAGSAGANILLVSQIPSGGTTLLCESEGNAKLSAWPNGTIIMLDIVCAVVRFQVIASAAIWFGSDNTVTNTGGGTAFEVLHTGGSDSIGQPQWNSIRSSELWMAGTLADTIGVAVIVV